MATHGNPIFPSASPRYWRHSATEVPRNYLKSPLKWEFWSERQACGDLIRETQEGQAGRKLLISEGLSLDGGSFLRRVNRDRVAELQGLSSLTASDSR